jgi:hypothetical protein
LHITRMKIRARKSMVLRAADLYFYGAH